MTTLPNGLPGQIAVICKQSQCMNAYIPGCVESVKARTNRSVFFFFFFKSLYCKFSPTFVWKRYDRRAKGRERPEVVYPKQSANSSLALRPRMKAVTPSARKQWTASQISWNREPGWGGRLNLGLADVSQLALGGNEKQLLWSKSHQAHGYRGAVRQGDSGMPLGSQKTLRPDPVKSPPPPRLVSRKC